MPMHEDSCTATFFHNSVSVIVGDDESTLFWKDRWLGIKCIADLVPNLLAAVPRRKQNSATVASALPDHAWIRDVCGVATVPILMQYLDLRQWLENWSVHPGMSDHFVWKWCSSGTYSTASAYRALFLGQASILGAKELWRIKAPNNIRFFSWLTVTPRVTTALITVISGLTMH
jgi:hypothetical protein